MCIKTRIQIALLIFLLPIYVTAEVIEYTDVSDIDCIDTINLVNTTYFETQTSAFDFTLRTFQSTGKGATGGRGLIFGSGSQNYEIECEGTFNINVNENTTFFPTPTTCTGIIDGITEFEFQTMEALITCNEAGDTCVSSLLNEEQVVKFSDGSPDVFRACSGNRTLVRTGRSTSGGDPTVILNNLLIYIMSLDPNELGMFQYTNSRQLILDRIQRAINNIAVDNIEGALSQLDNLITNRLNGCDRMVSPPSANPDFNDWVVDCLLQFQLRDQLQDARDLL